MAKIKFSGYSWSATERKGNPGPNHFSSKNAWVDKKGALHLKVSRNDKGWGCAEICLNKPLGYGKYSFEIEKPMFLDKNVILGMFTYQDDTKEIDLEFGRWGRTFAFNGQYVVQPSDNSSVKRFLSLSKNINISFDWNQDRIEFSNTSFPFKTKWNYTGNKTPKSEDKERVLINLWLYNKKKLCKEQEVVIKKFMFNKYQNGE